MTNKGSLSAAVIAMVAIGFSTEIWAQQQKNPIAVAPNKPELGQSTKPAAAPKPGNAAGAGATSVFSGSLYTFTLKSFKITDTRSLHNDTDFVSIAVAVGKNPPISLPTKSMGDLNNGTYQVNLSIPNINAGATDAVAFSYAIVNSGYDKNTIEQQLKKAVSDAAGKASAAGGSAAGGALGGSVGAEIGQYVGIQAGKWLIDKIEGIIFANCDGPVAAGYHVYSGAQLAHQTANGHIISATDDNKGQDSPTGCGGNSRYYVGWSISSHPKPPPVMKR